MAVDITINGSALQVTQADGTKIFIPKGQGSQRNDDEVIYVRDNVYKEAQAEVYLGSYENITISSVAATSFDQVLDYLAAFFNALGGGGGSINAGTVVGQMAYWSGLIWDPIDENDMFWDNTLKRLGIGTNSPRGELDVNGVNSETVKGVVKSLSEGVQADLFELALASNTGGGVSIQYVIEAINTGTNVVEMHYGKYNVIARNQNGAVTNADGHINEIDLPVGVGITVSFAITNGAGKITAAITTTSGITPTSLKIYYNIECRGTNSVTIL
jgi:hypothetical protein